MFLIHTRHSPHAAHGVHVNPGILGGPFIPSLYVRGRERVTCMRLAPATPCLSGGPGGVWSRVAVLVRLVERNRTSKCVSGPVSLCPCPCLCPCLCREGQRCWFVSRSWVAPPWSWHIGTGVPEIRSCGPDPRGSLKTRSLPPFGDLSLLSYVLPPISRGHPHGRREQLRWKPHGVPC